MDAAKSSHFLAALPGAFAFVVERPLVSLPQHGSTFQEVSSGHPGIREMTRQQWESLKPLIQRVYIEENKSFPYLVNILRDEHGFKPTKRQFSLKVKEWGFRKNVSRSERQRILPSLPRSMDEPVPNLQDRRLPSRKLRNWQRRYRGEVVEASALLPQQPHTQGLSKDFPEPDAQTHQVAEHAENPCAAPTHETSNDPSQSSGSVPSDAGPMEICQDRWPFDWSTVDVPGSPGLSRLFSALEIEAKTFVPPLSLETPESEDSRCLSNVEILVLSDKDRNAIPDDFDYLHLSRDGECSAPIGTASSHYPHYPWRDINAVFFGHAPSPFNEVYIFPPSYTAARKTPVSRITELEALELEETDLEIKFAKLKKQLHVDHPAVIAIMEDLAFIYWDLNKILKAERMYRRLVDIYRRTSASTPLKILKACLDVVDCVRMRGHFRKAQCMNQSLRAVLLKLVYPYHPLALNIMETDAIIAYHLGQNGKAECLRRELLQISLTASGPRNGKTMGLMISLGRTITKGKTKKVEGEMLLQTAVQLALDTNDEIMSDAIYLLTYTKPAEEAYNMITNAIERFRGTLGPRHPNIFHLQMHLAWNMLKLGMLHEGEKLYRALISLSAESRDGEWSCSDLSYLHKGLAKALRTTGRVEEAIYWYQKALEEQLTCYGANDVLTRGTCRGLAWCYQDQGRYDDALKLYHQMIDKVRQSGEDPDGANAEFESEILRIQERMEQSTSHSYSSDEESSEYESVSNSEGLYEGEQPAVETDEEPKGVANDEAEDHGIEEAESEEEKEDWMAFIIDLPTA